MFIFKFNIDKKKISTIIKILEIYLDKILLKNAEILCQIDNFNNTRILNNLNSILYFNIVFQEQVKIFDYILNNYYIKIFKLLN